MKSNDDDDDDDEAGEAFRHRQNLRHRSTLAHRLLLVGPSTCLSERNLAQSKEDFSNEIAK
jgi:hypothetical protein